MIYSNDGKFTFLSHYLFHRLTVVTLEFWRHIFISKVMRAFCLLILDSRILSSWRHGTTRSPHNLISLSSWRRMNSEPKIIGEKNNIFPFFTILYLWKNHFWEEKCYFYRLFLYVHPSVRMSFYVRGFSSLSAYYSSEHLSQFIPDFSIL